MSLQTTVFRPNKLEGFYFGDGSNPHIARCGGIKRALEGSPPDAVTNYYTNNCGYALDTECWDSGGSTIALIGSARSIALAIDKRWRTMFRFILREEVFQDASSIFSGPVPQFSWWQYVTAAAFTWYNGNVAPVEFGIDPNNMATDLNIRCGRTLYTPDPNSDREIPFGRDGSLWISERAATFNAATTFGLPLATLPWSDWGAQPHSSKTLSLGGVIRNTFLRTITGTNNSYLDISMVAAKEGVDGINFKQEIAAWEPHPPLLSVTFNVP